MDDEPGTLDEAALQDVVGGTGGLAGKLAGRAQALRITPGADGPAALVQAEAERARVAGLHQEVDAWNHSTTGLP